MSSASDFEECGSTAEGDDSESMASPKKAESPRVIEGESGGSTGAVGASRVSSGEVVVETVEVCSPKSSLTFVRPAKITLGYAELYGWIIIVMVLAARFIPFSIIFPNGSCLFRRLTGGWPCLTCGMTRCFDWFARGRFFDALKINPLGFFIACTGVILACYALLSPLRPPKPRLMLSPTGANVLRIAGVSIVVLNWLCLTLRHALGLWP